jgi:hypothetical protein
MRNLRTDQQQPRSLVHNSRSDAELSVLKWNSDAASVDGARHFCGEAHAQVYISRWFESICSPPEPDFRRRASVK